MRPRKTDRHLPPCVFHRHGAYYLVRRGKWTRLAADLPEALKEYARLHAQPSGGMAALIEGAMPGILAGKTAQTVAQYNVASRRLQEIFAEFAPHQVTPRDVMQLRRHFADSPATANRTISVLRQVMDYALEQELIDANPCVGIKRVPQQARTRRIERSEYDAIQAHADPLLSVVMDLCYLTGQRIGDVLKIRRADLRDDGIYVEQQKTKARVLVAWNPDLRAAVETAKGMWGAAAGLYLLRGLNFQPPTYVMIWKRWGKACAAAGVADATIHDLRAMSGTEAEAQGIDAQRLLGHTDGKMTRRYLRDKTLPLVEGPRRRPKNEKSA